MRRRCCREHLSTGDDVPNAGERQRAKRLNPLNTVAGSWHALKNLNRCVLTDLRAASKPDVGLLAVDVTWTFGTLCYVFPQVAEKNPLPFMSFG